MLSWALAFFIVAIIAAVFAFSGVLCTSTMEVTKWAERPPTGWSCPEGWDCHALYQIAPPPVPTNFKCPVGWVCQPVAQKVTECVAGHLIEVAKISFVVFVVLFLVFLVAGLFKRPY